MRYLYLLRTVGVAKLKSISKLKIGIFLIAIYFFKLSGLAQNNAYLTADENKTFEGNKQFVIALEKTINAKTPLVNILRIYTDLGKIYTAEKKYSKALVYLLKARKLNQNNACYYTHYNVALGSLFMEINANSVAIEFYKKEIHNEDHLNNYFQISTVASLYLRLFDYENALYYFNLQLKETMEMDDYIATASARNNIGIALFYSNRINEAINCFSQSIDELEKNKHKKSKNFQDEYSSLLSDVYDNLAKCYMIKNQYHVALKKFQHAYNLTKGSESEKSTRLVMSQAKALIHLNQRSEAEELIRTIDVDKLTLNTKIEFFRTKKSINLHAANYKELTSNLKQLESLYSERERQNVVNNDLMNKLVSTLMMSESLDRIEFEKKKKAALIKQHKFERLKNQITISIIIVIVLIILTLVLQVNKIKRKKIELEKEKLELEEAKLNQKLSAQNNHLTDFAIEKRIKDLKSKELLQNLQELKKNDSENISTAINDLINEIKQNDLNSQISNINQINEATDLLLMEFKTKLKEKHPVLSDVDLLLCQLIRLKLSNKEIANYKNITLESVKIAKNRLKKKLKIDPLVKITDYIGSF